MTAATPVLEPIDLREQLAHIDRMRAELQKLNADTLKVLRHPPSPSRSCCSTVPSRWLP